MTTVGATGWRDIPTRKRVMKRMCTEVTHTCGAVCGRAMPDGACARVPSVGVRNYTTHQHTPTRAATRRKGERERKEGRERRNANIENENIFSKNANNVTANRAGCAGQWGAGVSSALGLREGRARADGHRACRVQVWRGTEARDEISLLHSDPGATQGQDTPWVRFARVPCPRLRFERTRQATRRSVTP